jgi:hypothetical protein
MKTNKQMKTKLKQLLLSIFLSANQPRHATRGQRNQADSLTIVVLNGHQGYKTPGAK